MEKIVKNWRYWLMGAVALLAALNIIALPSPREEHFWLIFIGSKVAALVLLHIDVRLFVWFARHRQNRRHTACRGMTDIGL